MCCSVLQVMYEHSTSCELYVYIHIHICVYIYVYTHIHICVYIYVSRHVYVTDTQNDTSTRIFACEVCLSCVHYMHNVYILCVMYIHIQIFIMHINIIVCLSSVYYTHTVCPYPYTKYVSCITRYTLYVSYIFMYV